ncbi:MAG: T9SS type B sorting domain-containing protein [Robiginitalea sp.]
MLSIGFVLVFTSLRGQVSPDCSNAIPICNNTPINGGVQGYGINDFVARDSTGCLERSLSGVIESNSAWYRFRTGASGQLGFNIGFDPAEDWDFALYQASDCGDLGEPVRCNFFDNRDGNTYMGVGEDPTGDTATVQYEPWLQVEPGEDYYLLVNNFTNANTGFSIQFTGNIFVTNPYDALDCSIVSNLLGPPIAACEGDPVMLNATFDNVLEYQWYMDTGGGYQIIDGETGPDYEVSAPAFYRVQVTTVTPQNTLEYIISDVQVDFSPSAMSFPVENQDLCGETLFELHSLDSQALGSQSGEDFRVSYHLTQDDALLDTNPLPASWTPQDGINTVYYRVTSLENPLCYDASRSFEVNLVPPPQLDLPEEAYICVGLSQPTLGPDSPEDGVSYLWSTGEQTSLITVSEPGTYTLTATRSLGGLQCEVSDTVEVIGSVPPAIGEIVVEDMRSSNTVTVEPLQPGSFEYALNDGSYQSSPVFTGVPPGTHQLHMRDTQGCGSITETITVVGFNTFFTPNGDGQNDYWSIEGLRQLTEPQVFIFDRYGKLLKQLDPASPGWDGTFNGKPMPSSDYWFRLNYKDAQGQPVTAKYLRSHFSLKR